MKVSDMTNEELTMALMRRVPLDSNNYDDIREAAARLRKLKIAEDALTNSPCGVIYQLGISDDDGNFYDGVVIKFDEAEALKMPRVRQGDKFRVLPLNALAAI